MSEEPWEPDDPHPLARRPLLRSVVRKGTALEQGVATAPPPGLSRTDLLEWRRGCYLKVPFTTRDTALACAISTAVQRGYTGQEPYQCRFCSRPGAPRWHLGHGSRENDPKEASNPPKGDPL